MQGVFYVSIIADFILGFLAGFFGAAIWERDQARGSWLDSARLPLYPLLELGGLFASAVAMVTSGASFGLPDLGKGRGYMHLASCLWILLYSVPTAILRGFATDELRLVAEIMFCLISMPTVVIGIRGWPLLFAAALYLCGAFMSESISVLLIKSAYVISCSAFTRYLRDQRLVFCLLSQPICSYSFGHHVAVSLLCGRVTHMVYVNAFFSFAIVYAGLLLQRRHRYLPPGLQHARFVRLGYLRAMVKRGERIRRCQELPEEAFGDPMKALHLVIVSHRWLDQKTSDVATPACPIGLKLESLVQRLEEKFSPGFLRRSSSSDASAETSCQWPLHQRVHAACAVGGWDVVVFFDFMSIPQDGVTIDGSPIARTLEEEATFEECLPNMGTLYSLFPVLALVEVPEDTPYHGYMDSGWCVCEFTIALLGEQLHQYSKDVLKDYEQNREELLLQDGHRIVSGGPSTRAPRTPSTLDSQSSKRDDVRRLSACFIDKIESLRFTHQSDREVAQGIIRAFLTKRLISDMIWEGNPRGVEHVLQTLVAHNLQATLAEPVDSGLNTLLHVAVKARQPAAVQLLLQYGAPAGARNLLGDTPMQWYMLPRLGMAAWVCRRGRGAIRRGPTADWSHSGTVAKEASRRPSAIEAALCEAEEGTSRQQSHENSPSRLSLTPQNCNTPIVLSPRCGAPFKDKGSVFKVRTGSSTVVGTTICYHSSADTDQSVDASDKEMGAGNDVTLGSGSGNSMIQSI